jgi:alpha-galactosidase
MRFRFRFCLPVLVFVSISNFSVAVTITPAEMAEARRWAGAKFEGSVEKPVNASGLSVLENHGPVQPNARGGEPLRIGEKQYARGLYCHATSKVVVRLPKPGKTFSAEIGVDSRAGGGSVVFGVAVGGKSVFQSEVKHLQDAPQSVDVDLHGANEFTLEVGDGGDGISCDQANWADAQVMLNDGSKLWLGEMPILNGDELPLTTAAPISFVYEGRASKDFLATWKTERKSSHAAGCRLHTVSVTDPATGLVVRYEGVEWVDSPTVEWTVHFRNSGSADTPIIEKIRAIDTSFAYPQQGECILHYNTGDQCTADSYQPHADVMPAGFRKQIANTGGRPTQTAFPYFNMAWPNRGVMVAIGWPGQWSMEMVRDQEMGIRVMGGQELTHFKLHPGEEVRGPRIVVQFYSGDWIRGQNIWRRWMVAHNMPRPGGQPVKPMATLCTGNYYPGLMSNAQQELKFIQQYLDAGIKLDAWWQDAGWYPCDGVTWPKTGTWEVDRTRFPKGLREVSDFAHSHSMKSILWFEPERVHEGTWIAEQHAEWVYGMKTDGLLKLGEPEVRKWLTDHIDRLMTEQGIDVYRQDFNIDPLSYWRAADSEDRQGIAEIRHVEGYLAYFDELLRRHPGMFIDSCASGGRRNDIETLRRAVPLLRSDWYNSPEGQQCQTYGLALWFPFQGTGFIGARDRYWIRSSMVSELTFGPDASGLKNVDFKSLKTSIDDFHQVSDCFLGDFYPLTEYSLANDVWAAWQYDQPEAGKGVVQAFRRPACIYESARVPLRGLESDQTYEVTDLDTRKMTRLSGRELMEVGLPITLAARPSAGLLVYQRKP